VYVRHCQAQDYIFLLNKLMEPNSIMGYGMKHLLSEASFGLLNFNIATIYTKACLFPNYQIYMYVRSMKDCCASIYLIL